MILFVAYGGGHVALLAPVARALQKANRPFVFLALTTAGAYLEQLGIPHIGFRDFEEAHDPDVQNFGVMLAKDLPKGGSVPHEESVAYLGLNFRELAREHGEDKAHAIFKDKGRQAFLPVSLFERFLKKLHPSLLVTTNSPRCERASILAANRVGVKAICIVDLFAIQEVQWIGVPGYADRICVLNESVQKFLIEHNRNQEEIVITGNPAFDRLYSEQTINASVQLKTNRGWNGESLTILWASQIEPEQHPFTKRIGDPSLPRRIEAYLRNFLANNQNFRLVVRYHPSEREVFKNGPRIEFSPVSEDLGALLHAVDIVVVTASTVGLEASLIGRKVISVDNSIFTDDAPFSKMGISTGVQRVEDIGPELLKYAASKNLAASSIDATVPPESSSTQKILQVIDSLT